MINWKIVAIFPFFAIIISILSGAIGGASLLDIVIRAIVWAIVFGGIGIGVSFLIDRYFPELKGFIEEDNEKASAKSGGEGGFEAFIPEENPHELEEMKNSYFDTEEREADSDGESVRSRNEEDDGDIGVLSDVDETSNSSTEDFDDGLEKPDSDMDAGVVTDEESEMTSNGEPDIEETFDREIDDDTEKSSNDESSLVFEDDSIDKLPDSSSFDNSLSLSSPESSFDSGGSFSKPHKNANVSEFGQDPHKTARAIHTMIHRDKEG